MPWSLRYLSTHSQIMDRTNTAALTALRLPRPACANFDFSRKHHTRICIPQGSSWHSETHWHDHRSSCDVLECTEGRLKVSYSFESYSGGSSALPQGTHHSFHEGERTTWSSERRHKDLVVILVANETFYRNMCSAILDANRFPVLSSTPLWLRVLFKLLTLWPSAYQWLLSGLLWVQLQAIKHAHGYYTLHGTIRLVKLWQWTHPFDTVLPPKWLTKLQWQSQCILSKVTESACFWIGKCLGMRGQYPEDTPQYAYDEDGKAMHAR